MLGATGPASALSWITAKAVLEVTPYLPPFGKPLPSKTTSSRETTSTAGRKKSFLFSKHSRQEPPQGLSHWVFYSITQPVRTQWPAYCFFWANTETAYKNSVFWLFLKNMKFWQHWACTSASTRPAPLPGVRGFPFQTKHALHTYLIWSPSVAFVLLSAAPLPMLK